MKRYGFYSLVVSIISIYASILSATENPFLVSAKSVTQNMVKNSSQTIVLKLTTKVPPPKAVTVHCAAKTSSPNLSVSFNNNGCISQGGIGINSKLPATVNITLTASALATGSVRATITFTQTNGRSEPQIYKIPITIQTSVRTITFKNYCSYNVWFGISTSTVPAKSKNTIPCTTNDDCSTYTYSLCANGFCGGGVCQNDSDCVNSHMGTCAVPAGSAPGASASCSYCDVDSDCITGAECDTGSHQCNWSVPVPADAATDHYKLSPPNMGVIASNTITIPDNSSDNGYALQWGGGFGGRTGCTFAANKLTCNTAGCNTNGNGDNQGGCNLGEGFDAPSTLVETTFVANTPDTYDVTLINGHNLPISMSPTAGSAATPQSYNNPYICGKPGNASNTVTSKGTIGACSWTFSPPSVAFRWVDTDNATNCADDNTCEMINAAYRCGLTTTAIGTTPSSGSGQTTCGTPLGYWNQNEICAKNISYNQAGIVNCTEMNVGGSGNSLIELLGCTGGAAVSCYNVSSASTTCCGCTNWQNQGVTVPTNASIVAQCKFPNSNWGAGSSPTVTGSVLPGLIWLKQACPSAYVYPYDDKSSTFTCPSNNSQSGVDYTVEFCPQ